MQQVSDLRAQTQLAIDGEIVEGLFAPAAYPQTLPHVDEVAGKAWRSNTATRVHNDALRYARLTWLALDEQGALAQDSLVDWLVHVADSMYAQHLQTLINWEVEALEQIVVTLMPNSAKAERTAWLKAFLSVVQAESSLTKKQMTALQAAVDAGAAQVASSRKLSGQHIGGKRAKKLLARFKH